MSKAKQPKPNDQRSTVKNPTSKEYPKDKANTAKQNKGNEKGNGKK